MLILVTNYIVDPYQQYRKTSFYTFLVKSERYINPGLLKHYDYDSLLIGTSMVANFKASEIEKKLGFNKLIKVPTFGGVISEQIETIEFAQKYKKVNNILFGLDVHSFSGFNIPTENKEDFPNYLYDDSILNDSKYLFSTRVFGRSLRSITKRYDEKKVSEQLDNLYEWQTEHESMFNQGKNAKADYLLQKNRYNTFENYYKYEKFKYNFDQYFLPFIETNKGVNIYLFFPPYSILYYKLMEKSGYLEDYLRFKRYIFFVTKKYKNIKLYDFQSAYDVTSNLSNYKDITHYHQKINSWMLDKISKGRYIKTIDINKDKEFMNYIRSFELLHNKESKK